MKKVVFLVLAAIAVSAFADRPKYVFLFIGDGMAGPQREAAQAVALAAVKDQRWIRRNADKVIRTRTWFVEELEKRGVCVS